jgi:tyrosine-protein phosphatase SIW14
VSAKYRFRTAVFALSLAVSAPLPSYAASRAAAAGQAIALPAIGIDNFGRVSANYFRGGQPKGQDFATLAKLGVKMVIDLAREGDVAEAANAERAGMKFVRIPLTTDVAPSAAVIEKFLALVNDPANQPVYVHCMGGRHRTGAMTAVYRMTQNGWNADRAFAEMKQYKFGADFLHPALKAFVYDFFSQFSKMKAAPQQASAAIVG